MRTRTRWTVAGTTAAAVVATTVALPAIASADPDLPPTTAQELLADLAEADARPFSGTVVHTADLGLPELPQGEGSSADLTSLLAGSTTLRVWSAGPDLGRVAVVGAFSETDLVRNGDDAWVWRSDERSAVHATLPDGADDPSVGDGPAGSAATPDEAAQQALEAVDPSTEVTLGEETTVAGRDAYELVMTPRADDTLVGQVRLAVDAQTRYPLRVQVIAAGASEPALETSFTSISYDTPDESVFDFTPPAGTEVTEAPSPEELKASMAGKGGAGATAGGDAEHDDRSGLHGAHSHAEGSDGDAPQDAAAERTTVVGEGWEAVAVTRDAAGSLDEMAAGGRGGPQGADGEAGEIAQALEGAFAPVSGAYGDGRVFTSALVSVLTLDDGRVLVGAVPPAVLEAAALDPTAAP